MSTQLNKLETWVLAQIILGSVDALDLPAGMSSSAAGIAVNLLAVQPRDREYLALRYLVESQMKAIRLVNPDDPMPVSSEQPGRWIIHASQLKNRPGTKWIIDGEIPERGVTVIYGESGAGKSFVGIDYAMRIAQTRRVCYIPTEGESGYTTRVEAWCAYHKQPYGECYFMGGNVSLFERDEFEGMLLDLKNLKPELTIIDTLAMAAAGMDENSARDMSLVLKSCRRIISDVGSAVILVHHTNAGGMIERGSKALRGNTDSMIRVNPADDLIIIESTKTKDMALPAPRRMALLPVMVAGIGESLVVVPPEVVHTSPDHFTSAQRRLLDALSMETSRDGITIRDIQELTGLSFGTINRALSNLKTKKLVHKPKGSYALNAAGLKAAGVESDPLDPLSESAVGSSFSPHDPGDPGDPPILRFNSGKALVDQADQADQSGSSGSNGSLFDLDELTKTPNYYQKELQS